MSYTYTLPELKASITKNHDATEVTFTETTGTYNITTNPYGWGAPGAMSIAAVDSVNLTVETPSGDSYTFNPFPTLPSSSSGAFTFDMGDIGGTAGDVFPDGLYTITYEVVDNADRSALAPLTKYFFVCFELEKCISKALANADISDCCCDCQEMKNLLTLYMIWKALKFAVCTGNTTRINRLYESAKKLCDQLGCENC